ncbi:MAG: hypothetical protein ACKO54_11130, partial [Alphaproteobacteria bacterium]
MNLLKFCDNGVVGFALKFDGAKNIVGLFGLNPAPHQAQKPRRVTDDIAEQPSDRRFLPGCAAILAAWARILFAPLRRQAEP